MNPGSIVHILLRYSWLLVTLIGLATSSGLYHHHQSLNEQLVNNEITLRSQVKLDTIRAMMQQHLDASQTIVAFMQGEILAHSYIEEEEAAGFLRALLDIHKGELQAIALFPQPDLGEPLVMHQRNSAPTAPLPDLAQLEQITADSSTLWQVEKTADYTVLRTTIISSKDNHRSYVICDWDLQALFDHAINATPTAGLGVRVDMKRDHLQQHLFTHQSRLGEGQSTTVDRQSWQGTFSLSDTRFIVYTQPVPELLLGQLSSNFGAWLLLLGLLSTALLAVLLFKIFRADEQLQSEVETRTSELSGEREKLAAVIDHAHDGILVCDTNGAILRANPAADAMFGYDNPDWSTITIHDLVPEHLREEHGDLFTQEITDTGSNISDRARQLHGQRRDGSRFPCQATVHSFIANGEQRMSIVLRDMTEQKCREWVQNTLLKLRATSQASAPLHTRLKQMLEDLLMDPWQVTSRAGAIFIARGNQQWLTASYGWSVIEKRRFITLPQDHCICGNIPGSCNNPEMGRNQCEAQTADTYPSRLCMHITHHDRSLGLLHLQLRDAGPIPEEFLRFCEQAKEIISELLLREHVRQALEESENKHRQLVENTPMGIVIYTNGKVRYVNPAAVTMLGASSADDLLDRAVLDFIVEEERDSVSAHFQTLQQAGYVQSAEERFQRLDGGVFWGEIRGVPIEYESRPSVQLLIQDISARKQAQEQLKLLSYSDELTGLPNRRLYTDRVEQACSMARRSKRPISLFFLDLDRFKVINDTRGHACGDQVLKVVAERLMQTLRLSDTAARMGGDEFAVLLPETEPDKALHVAGKLIAALKQPIYLEDQSTVIIGASIGLASFPTDGEDGTTLLKHADSAMYYAKQNHMDIHCFSSAMESVAMRRMYLEGELAVAAEKGQLSLHYQSQHALPAHGTETTITGVESLMRWHHPEMGMISPAEFIPLAEETGLIKPITVWAIAEASRQALIWEQAGIRPNRISINISAAQLMQQDLASDILSLIRDSGAQPEWIEIEVTETAVMNQPETGIAIMRELVNGGASIAIDDFGTGYSSLAYLKRLPADLLKIDIAFIRDLPDDAEDAVIVRTIIAMAHALGLRVLAEGVETTAQLEFLRREGCDLIQGYLLGRPLPADEATIMLGAGKLAV